MLDSVQDVCNSSSAIKITSPVLIMLSPRKDLFGFM